MAVAAAPETSISERAIEAREARMDRFLAMVLDLIVFGGPVIHRQQRVRRRAGLPAGEAPMGLGRVTYPLNVYEGGKACTGSISLNWSWTGWEMSEGTLLCRP